MFVFHTSVGGGDFWSSSRELFAEQKSNPTAANPLETMVPACGQFWVSQGHSNLKDHIFSRTVHQYSAHPPLKNGEFFFIHIKHHQTNHSLSLSQSRTQCHSSWRMVNVLLKNDMQAVGAWDVLRLTFQEHTTEIGCVGMLLWDWCLGLMNYGYFFLKYQKKNSPRVSSSFILLKPILHWQTWYQSLEPEKKHT